MNVTELTNKMGFDGIVLAHGMENTLQALPDQMHSAECQVQRQQGRPPVSSSDRIHRKECLRIVRGCEY